MFSMSIRFLLVALISSLHVSEYYASRIVVGSMPTDLTTADSQQSTRQSRHLMASASSICDPVSKDNGPSTGNSIGNKVVAAAAGLARAAPVPGLSGAVTFLGGQFVKTFFPYEAATPADTYNCMVAFVEEAVSKAVNNLENKLIQNNLNDIGNLIKEIHNLLSTAEKTNKTDPFTVIQTKVTTLDQKFKDAINQILKVEDKAANLMPLYLLVTSQVLPLANFVYINYDAIFKDESESTKTFWKQIIINDVNDNLNLVIKSWSTFRHAAIFSRTNQIQNVTADKLCKGMKEDKDIITTGMGSSTRGSSSMCQFYDPGANSDGAQLCGRKAGISFDNNLMGVNEADWGNANVFLLNALKTESKWIYGRDAAKDAQEMMKRNAETVAKINVHVATAGSRLWRAMLPGQIKRPTITQRLVSRSTLPFGPAEFYCELGKTNESDPIDICAPQLNSMAYTDGEKQTPFKKTGLKSKDWAMVSDNSVKAWSDGFNITKIEIASGAYIDGITVGISGSSDTSLGTMKSGTKRTIDTDNGMNPIVRVDIYARKNYHGIARITGLKFFQKNSPQEGIMTGKNEGCGPENEYLTEEGYLKESYGFLGSYHYEFDFTQWEGQVWLCGLDMFSTNPSTRVEAVGPRWCYNEFVLSS